MEQTIIRIKPFNIENSVIKSHDTKGLPTTNRRYRINNDIKNSLENYNYEKKGTIDINELRRIKPSFNDELPIYETEYSIEEVFSMLGKLNGLASSDSDPLYKKNSISPEVLNKTIEKINSEIEKEILKQDDKIKLLNSEIEEKDAIIRKQNIKIDALIETVNQFKKDNEQIDYIEIEEEKTKVA